MSNYTFSKMPTVGISRSRFERTSQHKTTFNLGKIVPIYVDEVYPGDTRSLDLAALIRMSTPIAPIMDNIHLDFFAFFVPNRLVCDHWREIMGENRTSAGIPMDTYYVPGLRLEYTDGMVMDPNDNLLLYMGVPQEVAYTNSPGVAESGQPSLFINALPFRGYYLIYNEWFRNQNIIAPIAVYTGDNEGVIVSNPGSDHLLPLCTASKLPDYFTKALPYLQKGNAIQIPMGNFAPLIANRSTMLAPEFNALQGSVLLGTGNGPNYTVSSSHHLTTGLLGGLFDTSGVATDANNEIKATNLGVNVAAIAGTIDQLRYAFQLQKLLWKDAAYGSRYWELLASHFGITAPDASLQRPEYLGGKRMEINIDQVLSTAGYSNTDSTTVGATGANSVSSFKGSIFTKSFTEHGWVYILAVARHDQTYGQGLNRMFSRRSRFDYYWPVFANLAGQEIKKQELFVDSTILTESHTTCSNDEVFGYQEAWAELRFKPSIVSGLLNPSTANSLDFWTLASDFESAPTLGKTFIEQGRSNLSRALVTSSTGPDFIADFYFRDIAVRPIPMFSLPGYADHH